MSISPDVMKIFDDTYHSFPTDLRWLMDDNKARLLWQVQLVKDTIPAGGELVDIGAGLLPFMSMCQDLGYVTTIVDDLADNTYKSEGTEAVIRSFTEKGVRIFTDDALENEVPPITTEGYSLVTTHDSIEHWRNSPKTMFHRLWSNMREGGVLWIGAPNCVNLRKRITVPLGYGKWSQMKDWYEEETFRGHIREPDVGDYRYIAKDLGASKVQILGRNWLGYRSANPTIRAVTPIVDRILQLRPSLCSDIYVLAHK